MLSPCECGGKKIPSSYCKTTFPGIHGWKCSKCISSGQCYCIGNHQEEDFFDTNDEAFKESLRRAGRPVPE